MKGIRKRKWIRRSFIPRLLPVIVILSTVGCSSSMEAKQLRERAFVEDSTAVQQEASVENNAAVQQNASGVELDYDIENNSDLEMEKVVEAEEVLDFLQTALLPEEVLIDWVQDTSYTYALVHSEGNLEYGDTLLIWKEEDGALIRTYENDFRELMPWKIDTADIDGDLEKEILVAVKKTTPYDKIVKNRMFIFHYRDGLLVKKWTGSQIAGTWRDFYTADLVDASGEELIFLEQLKEGQERIKVYYWFDFGFFLLAESEEYTKVKELTVSGENSLQVTLSEGRQFHLTMKDGKLVETEK